MILNEINLESEIRTSILANDIHIYPISQTLIQNNNNFAFEINFTKKLKQDYGLQAWISTDIWGQKSRTYLTRIDMKKSIRMLNKEFLEEYNIGDIELNKLMSLYHGIICIFSKNDPDIFLHIRNVEGRNLEYKISEDTENFLVYLNAIGLVDNTGFDIVC